MSFNSTSVPISANDIAVIGMSCRFPGAANPGEFWDNLIQGREGITFFSQAELAAAGVEAGQYRHRAYVPARGVLAGIELFDPLPFAMTSAEAAITDPQQRLFLECAWEALEDGACDPDRFAGPIGVYGGTGANSYLHGQVLPQLRPGDLAAWYQAMQGNEKDFLATRVAYKLNLTGPAISVQSACSSSLVAVHCACQAILNGECDLALAGGVAIFLPQDRGYLYQEGMILSPDGHCRPFDAAAAGTVPGSGAGMVLLKRLEDALADGDHIHGIIKGSAVNNDGAGKVGFTAPGVEGQVRVIREALAVAGVEPEEIAYLESHGTATHMGDPVEIEALGRAFAIKGKERGLCLLGSVKSNIGHCDAAAGIAGLIKTLLALQHEEIPPSLHFKTPNPAIDFAATPFAVCAEPSPWPKKGKVRLAGVSSFGMGGTNAHLILQQAPPADRLPPEESPRPWFLLPLSGKSPTAVGKLAGSLARHLAEHPEIAPADLAATLQLGRRQLNHRSYVLCRNTPEAAAALTKLAESSGESATSFAEEPSDCPAHVRGNRSAVPQVGASGPAPRTVGYASRADRPCQSSAASADNMGCCWTVTPVVTFMFPGQGSQFVGMGGELYAQEPLFRAAVDQCAEILQPLIGRDPRPFITSDDPTLAADLRRTELAQPLLFTLEYAYAALLAAWGVRPQAVIGHSLGEYVAACLAGIFTLEDALTLVAARGALMQRRPAGKMVAVQLKENELGDLLRPGLDLAAVNGASCTLSGPEAAVEQLVARCVAQGVGHLVLDTSHAFHSAIFAETAAEFAAVVEKIPRRAPKIPLIANLTGLVLTEEEALSTTYWARQLRHTVRFSAGLESLAAEPARLLLEVGPGTTLANLARKHLPSSAGPRVLAVGRHPRERQSPDGQSQLRQGCARSFYNAVGELWSAGVAVNWSALSPPATSRRLSLPTYPFEREEHWLGPEKSGAEKSEPTGQTLASGGANHWLYAPVWRRLPVEPMQDGGEADRRWWPGRRLLLAPPGPVPEALCRRLEELGAQVTLITPAASSANRLDELLAAPLVTAPLHLIYAHPLDESIGDQELLSRFLTFTRTLVGLRPLFLDILTFGIHDLTGAEPLRPGRAALPAFARSLALENPAIRCRCLDCGFSAAEPELSGRRLDNLAAELLNPQNRGSVALRGGYRWQESYQPVALTSPPPAIRRHGTYLVTGGLGDIGLALAEGLAANSPLNLVLTRRSPFPRREEWESWMARQGGQHPTSRIIRRLLALEEQGVGIMAVAADVCSMAEMGVLLQEVTDRFGKINGCVHAAGVTGAGAISPYGELSREKIARIFAPKHQGYLVLRDLLTDPAIDFLLAISSLSSLLGGRGMAAYAGANAAMAAQIVADNRKGGRWLCVDWDGWRFDAAATPADRLPRGACDLLPAGDSAGGSAAVTRAIPAAVGVEQLLRLSAWRGGARLAVSLTDLNRRLESIPEPVPSRSPVPAPGPLSGTIPAVSGTCQPVAAARKQESRVGAGEDELEPMERLVRDTWRAVLGRVEIMPEDNFFALGGSSLQLVQVHSRLQESLGVEFPLRHLFEGPGLLEVAELLRQVGEGRKPTPETSHSQAPRPQVPREEVEF